MAEHRIHLLFSEIALIPFHFIDKRTAIAVLHKDVDVVGWLDFYLFDVDKVGVLLQLLHDLQLFQGDLLLLLVAQFDDLDRVLGWGGFV